MENTLEHSRFMDTALSLATRNLGQTWPNPAVGAVVVKNNHIIGEGCTARGGRPHAETEALAGIDAKGATLYVTLEPCSHHGKTPPCTEAIINAGITRCVIACHDPNPQVNGKGIAMLQAAGIEVIENIGTEKALEINRGFFSVMQKKRPYIALKLATSLDYKITHPTERWITGESARNYGHLLRSRYDAIATGIGTVLTDNPSLTCRLPGLEDRSPVRVVFDRGLRIPEDCQLVETADKVPVWVLTSSRRRPGSTPLPDSVQIIDMGADLRRDVELLAERGITRLLVEGGQQLSTAFLQSGLVDRIYWFRAPITVGRDGLDALTGGFSSFLSGLAEGKPIDHISLHPDTLDIFECSPAS